MSHVRPAIRNFMRGAAALAFVVATCGRLLALESSEWKFHQTIAVDAPGIVTVRLPPATLDAARPDWGDLRLVDSGAREVAYVMRRETRPVSRPQVVKSLRTRLTDTTTELSIECGEGAIEEITLDTPAPEFVKRVRVETSDDGSSWHVVAEDVALFRQRGAQQLTVRVTQPRVRITVDDTRSPPIAFTGARFTRAITGTPRQSLDARIARRDEFAGETVLTVELAAAHVPLDALVVTTPERLFTRHVSAGVREFRDEAAVERTLATGWLSRVAVEGDGRADERVLPLGFDAPARELLVHIRNEDSPPLAVTRVEVSRFEVELVFDAPTAGEYRLLSGNPTVATPRYDLTSLRVAGTKAAAAVEPGPLVTNASYRAPEALAGIALRGAAFDPSGWAFRKNVGLAASGVYQLDLDLDVLAHTQGSAADVRLAQAAVQIPYVLERPSASRPVALELSAANNPRRPRISRWAARLPRTALPVRQLTLTSPSSLFERTVRVFEKVTDDRGNTFERTFASADWRRTPGERKALVIALSATPSTDTLLIETDNGDNPPLAIDTATAAVPVAQLFFKAEKSSGTDSIVLYYGNRQAGAPRYDLALVAKEILAAEKHAATLGPEEKVLPEGWSKLTLTQGRGAILFWSALILVVVALLVVVAKLLPKPLNAS